MANINRKRMRSTQIKDYIRVSAKIPAAKYAVAKYVYGLQRISLDQKIQELIDKDILLAMKQKWLIDELRKEPGVEFARFFKAIAEEREDFSTTTDKMDEANNTESDQEDPL